MEMFYIRKNINRQIVGVSVDNWLIIIIIIIEKKTIENIPFRVPESQMSSSKLIYYIMINDFEIEVNGNNRRSFKQWINHTIRISVRNHENTKGFFSMESLLCTFSRIERRWRWWVACMKHVHNVRRVFDVVWCLGSMVHWTPVFINYYLSL